MPPIPSLRLSRAVAAFLGLGLSATGCANGTPSGGTTAASASGYIGAQGGTVSVAAAEDVSLAGTSITVPAGALTMTTLIAITSSTLAVTQAGDAAGGPVADFAPNGLTFATPVTITLPVTIPAGETQDDLLIEAVESDGTARQIAVSSVSGGLATFQTTSFTRFGCAFHHRADAGTSDAGVVCNCPEVPSGACTEPGVPPCSCPAVVACDGGSAIDAGALLWYWTCGDPVCFTGDAGPAVDAGVCPDAGTSCSSLGETCGTPSQANCGATLICDDQDPRIGGCPISSRQFKDDVQYLDPTGLQRLHDETLQMRLATYHYKSAFGDPASKHLGFIIEDQPQMSPAVDRGHDRVDLYGYMSMVVATMQVQEAEIRQLRRDLEEARKGSCPARKSAK